ncbi:Cd40 [Phodopus roborovskii]|uniref:Tumor necrosis factor receptor superfamily member 5 n=1 Tax=Phodopus roborovskii TaxID=109678 RepID=A0AAU9YQG1_PHORO|nr:Cd40 [Phodopus roborovskii]
MVTLRQRQCVLWGCLLTAVHLGQCITCDDKQYLFDGQCCDLCQPGKRLESHCTALAKTQCLLCGSGEFMNKWNKEPRCYQHTHCESKEGLQVEKEGTSDTDTICACKEGQHCTSEECGRCAQHTSCGPGFGVKQMATRTTDTVCEPCPAGFFSNGSSTFEKCHPWTNCEAKNMVVRQEGTNWTDAVCEKVVKEPKDNKALPPAVERGDPTETEDCPGHNTVAPVQETLRGCQPVTQEDGKESRIAVQERQLTDNMDLKHLA